MKTCKRNRWLSFLLALIMVVGMLPLATLLPARNVSAASYPKLTSLVEGTEILYGYVYFFYKNGTAYREN